MGANVVDYYKATARGSLRVFSMYADLPASVRARWAYKTLSRMAGENWIVSTELWKMDSLRSSDVVRRMIVEGGAKADIILVAASALDCRQDELVSWLEQIAACHSVQRTDGLLIGLFGDDDNLTSELGWTVKQFIRCARHIGRDFIWQWMGREAMNEPSWLTDKFEEFLASHRVDSSIKPA